MRIAVVGLTDYDEPSQAGSRGTDLARFDDVFTTGATGKGCVKVSRTARAREVVALAVARGV